MKLLIFLSLFILLFSCREDSEKVDCIPPVVIPLDKDVDINPLDSIIPNNLSPDKSWIIEIEKAESVLLGYTIHFQTGEELTIKLDPSKNPIDIKDYSHTKWEDNNTFHITNLNSWGKGFYDLYIYKDGTYKYIENNLNQDTLKSK